MQTRGRERTSWRLDVYRRAPQLESGKAAGGEAIAVELGPDAAAAGLGTHLQPLVVGGTKLPRYQGTNRRRGPGAELLRGPRGGGALRRGGAWPHHRRGA